MTNALWQRMACLYEGTDLTLHPGDDCLRSSAEEEDNEPKQKLLLKLDFDWKSSKSIHLGSDITGVCVHPAGS